MKHFFALSVLIVTMAAMLAAQAPPPAPSTSTATKPSASPSEEASTQKARAILDKMIAAMGGEAFLKYQDRTEIGRTYSFYHGQPNGVGAPYTRFWKWPDKERVELLKKREWIVIYNADKATESTFHGTVRLDDKKLQDYLRNREYSLPVVLRTWLSKPDTALFYEGKTVAANRAAEQISILNSENRGVTLFIDSNSNLLLKKSFTYRDPETKERIERSETYENYRTLQGISTPLSVTIYKNDDPETQRFLNSVSYNTNLPDSDFALASDQAPPHTLGIK